LEGTGSLLGAPKSTPATLTHHSSPVSPAPAKNIFGGANIPAKEGENEKPSIFSKPNFQSSSLGFLKKPDEATTAPVIPTTGLFGNKPSMFGTPTGNPSTQLFPSNLTSGEGTALFGKPLATPVSNPKGIFDTSSTVQTPILSSLFKPNTIVDGTNSLFNTRK
jgi:hypothetical protein